MIDYISGPIAEVNPTAAVIDCSGIGYEINITLLDYATLQKENKAKLYIHEAIRDDAHLLYGFLTRRGRELFRLLISVSGVGAGTARLILSAMTPDDLAAAISSGNDSVLKAVKGIGAKTAQRIIVDLRDKIKADAGALVTKGVVPSEVFDEALGALGVLGFTRQQSEKALRKVLSAEPGLNVEQAIRRALSIL